MPSGHGCLGSGVFEKAHSVQAMGLHVYCNYIAREGYTCRPIGQASILRVQYQG